MTKSQKGSADGSQRKNSVGHQSATATGAALSIAAPFAQLPENCTETSRRGGLPLILTLRLVAMVLKVLEPTDVVAQHGPIALR